MRQDIESILYDAECIHDRVLQVGTRITRDYQDKDLLLVGVLKGSFVFLADLARSIDLPVEVDFMVVSSYGSGTESSGVLTIAKDLSVPVEGRHVLIVEDVVDSGLSMQFLMRQFEARGARSLRLAALVDKNERREVDVRVDFAGFKLEEGFIVGYGLDYAEKYRALPDVEELVFESAGD